MSPDKKRSLNDLIGAALLLAVAFFAYLVGGFGILAGSKPSNQTFGSANAAANIQSSNAKPKGVADVPNVTVSDTQLSFVKVEPVSEHEFPIEKQAVGTIAFNEEMSVQVFTPYQGRIIGLFAKVGDDVKQGDTLFTIDSPDLLQAESTLISTAGTREFTTRNLARLKELYASRAISQKDLEQATSDQQAAEGALRAARDAVRQFGKTEAEVDRIIAERSADSTLVVRSSIAGRVTARNAAPGLFVQPGNAPAPYTIADIDTMWMLANVAEMDSPAFRIGQDVNVQVSAFPDRVFHGKITTIGSAVDPNTRRVLVRSEIADPEHQLKSNMFANFTIDVGQPVRSPAVPIDGVVREGDGTITVWVTSDRHRFARRTVRIGQQRDGYRQILDGVRTGELVVTEGALFLSNAFATESRGRNAASD